MAAAAFHAQELGGAFVEFMIPHRRDGELHRVHRLDRRLVVKERGDERRRADDVAGGDDNRIRVPADRVRQMCCYRYSAPPATVALIWPSAPDGGSRLPWKSLNVSNWTATRRVARIVRWFPCRKATGSPSATMNTSSLYDYPHTGVPSGVPMKTDRMGWRRFYIIRTC